MKCKKNIGVQLFIFVTAALFLLSCGDGDSAIEIVKSGYFNGYPGKSIGKAVDDFFGNTEWTKEYSEDNLSLVRMKGFSFLFDEPKDVILEFIVNEDTEVFALDRLIIDGEVQSEKVLNYVLTQVFEEDSADENLSEEITDEMIYDVLHEIFEE